MKQRGGAVQKRSQRGGGARGGGRGGGNNVRQTQAATQAAQKRLLQAKKTLQLAIQVLTIAAFTKTVDFSIFISFMG